MMCCLHVPIASLFPPTPAIEPAIVADQSAASQKMMELQMFNHLKNVRMLCKPEQLPKFDSLFVKILNKRGGEGRKKQADK
jgi:hypothetical protein